MEKSKRKGLSAAVLKNIAVISMLIDHITMAFFRGTRWYDTGRILGRFAFVLFAFLIAEGATLTRSRRNYALRLLACGFLSIVPQNCFHGVKLLSFDSFNIFFTLFLGLLTICIWEWISESVKNTNYALLLKLLFLFCIGVTASIAGIEYGLMGIALITVFSVCRRHRLNMLLLAAAVILLLYPVHVMLSKGLSAWLTANSGQYLKAFFRPDRIQGFGVLALPLIGLYSGEKGKQLPKWFYYGFYPAHLAILGLIKSIQ